MRHRPEVAWACLLGASVLLAGCKCCSEGTCLKKNGDPHTLAKQPSLPSAPGTSIAGTAKPASPAITDAPAPSYNPMARPTTGASPVTPTGHYDSPSFPAGGKPTSYAPPPGRQTDMPANSVPAPATGRGPALPDASFDGGSLRGVPTKTGVPSTVEGTSKSSPQVDPMRSTLDYSTVPLSPSERPSAAPVKPTVDADSLRSQPSPQLPNGDRIYDVQGSAPAAPAVGSPASSALPPPLPPLPDDGPAFPTLPPDSK